MRFIIKLIFPIFALGIVTCADVYSQSGFPKQTKVSPFEIKRQIEYASGKYKKQTSVKIDFDEIWKSLGIAGEDYITCGSCEAKIYQEELDGKPTKEILLKLVYPFYVGRYLIFGRTANPRKWIFYGYVDHDFNRYEMTSHKFVGIGNKKWLAIRGQEGSGTGYVLYGETYYEISKRGVQPVLRYLSEGHTYPWPDGLGREFKTKPILTKKNNKELFVTIRYKVTYQTTDYINEEFRTLLTNTHHLSYKWSRKEKEFVYNKSKSDVTEYDIDIIANVESEENSGETIGGSTFYSSKKSFVGSGYEFFLKHNVARLMKIAKAGNAKLKDWLRKFLDECDNIPEKKKLIEALRK